MYTAYTPQDITGRDLQFISRLQISIFTGSTWTMQRGAQKDAVYICGHMSVIMLKNDALGVESSGSL